MSLFGVTPSPTERGRDSLDGAPPTSALRLEGSTTAAMALGLGVALALVVDLSSPPMAGAHMTTTTRRAADADGLGGRMEAQVAAGAPGVALAIEAAAPESQRANAAVAAARAHAQFELGDAPGALRTTRMALRICDATGGCRPPERASLERLDAIIGPIVEAGVIDPKTDPKRVQRAIRDVIPAELSFVK